MTSKPRKRGIVERMKDIWPMYKLCLLLIREQNKWQKGDLDARILLESYRGKSLAEIKDKDILMEREMRVATGEGSGVSRFRLIDEYIKRYNPEHTKPSDAFGALVQIDTNKPNAEYLHADIYQIIEKCLSSKYGFLEIKGGDPNRVYLTGEGSFFAGGPYVKVGNFPLSIFGLPKAYITAMEQVWFIILNLLGLYVNWILWMSDLMVK